MIWSVYSSEVTNETYHHLRNEMCLDDFLLLKQQVDIHEDMKMAFHKDEEAKRLAESNKPRGR